jgi:hypothetical protein
MPDSIAKLRRFPKEASAAEAVRILSTLLALQGPMTCHLRVHVRSENGINPGLVATLLAEPFQQILVQPHGHDSLPGGPDDFGVFPELHIGGASVRVRFDAAAYFGITQAAQTAPVCAESFLTTRRSSNRRAFHALLIAMPR